MVWKDVLNNRKYDDFIGEMAEKLLYLDGIIICLNCLHF